MSTPRAGELLGQRYVLSDPLGDGASSVVFRAQDRWTARAVAVKVLGADDPAAAAREYDVAHDADHPALARALDLGRFGPHPYVVFELAEGEAFDRALAGADHPSVALVLDELLGALAFLHGRGLVHADLKPDNVRVGRRDGRPTGRLLDLGLARAPGELGGGNTVYGAPEAMGGAAVCASDLFSLGAMAHEVIAGALPFGDPQDGAYLERLLRGRRVPAGDLGALGPWIDRLLAVDPRVRFRSALDARAALRALVGDGVFAAERPQSPPLIDRATLIARAASHFAHSRSRSGEGARGRDARGPGQPGHDHPTAAPLVLTGASGTGRTRLLGRVAVEARLHGMHTIEVDARAGFGPLLSALLDGLRRLGEAPDRAAQILGADLAEDDHRYAALFAILDALTDAAERAPLRVLVDDLDRADESTQQAVRFLANTSRSDALGFVVVDTAAPEGAALVLEPLDVDGVQRLLAAMLPGLDDAASLARLAHDRTSGEPARLVHGVGRLAQSGAVRFCETGWQIGAEGASDDAFAELSPARLDAIVEALPPSDRVALAAIVFGGGRLETAVERLGLSHRERSRAERLGVRTGLLRPSGGDWVLVSAQAGQAVVHGLTRDDGDALRERAVASLRDVVDPAARALRAEHLAALGRHEEAAADALVAARGALTHGQPATAAAWLRDAVRWGGDPVARDVSAELGRLLAVQGALDDALAVLDRGRAAGADAAALDRVQGRVLARAGRYDDALPSLSAVANAPGATPEDRYWLGWSLMMRGRYEEASPLAVERAGTARDRALLGRLAGTIAWHRGHVEEACDRLIEARAAALEAGDPLVRVEVEQSLGTAERIRGRLDVAGACFREAVRLAREHGFAAILAKCLNNLAINEYQAGRWSEATRAWDSMHELALRLDAHEEVLLANNNLALVYRDRGEHARATDALERACEIARRLGIARYEAMVLGNRAEVAVLEGRLDAARRDLDEAEAIAERIDAGGELLECAVRRAALRMAEGDAERALESALDAAERAGDAHLERGNALLIAAAAARSLGRLDASAAHLSAATDALERGGTRLERARAQLEEAKLRAARDDRAGSRALARSAGRTFADLGAERELAEARGLEDQDEVAERGQALLELLQRAASAPDVDALLDGVIERVLELTRADRGYVLLLEGENAPRVAAMRGVDEGELPRLSRGIADRVVASGRALVLANLGEEMELASRASVMGMGLRAALCAPLMRGDRCLGLLYIDSRCGPELVRFGLWMVDAAAAILVPALERLLDNELDRERVALLEASAVDTLEMLSAVDAALVLAEDEADPQRRGRLLGAARDQVESGVARAEGLLELLRVGEHDRPAVEEAVDLDALLRAALATGAHVGSRPERTMWRALDAASAPASDIAPRVDLSGAPSHVAGDLEQLASLFGRMVDTVRRQVDHPGKVSVRARAVGGRAAPGTGSWRPGQSVGHGFVRVEVRTDDAPLRPELLDAEASEEALTLRAAHRLARRCGGRLFRVHDDGGRLMIVAELPAASEERVA